MPLQYNFFIESQFYSVGRNSKPIFAVVSGLYAHFSSLSNSRVEIGTSVFGKHLFDANVLRLEERPDYNLVSCIAFGYVHGTRKLYDDIGYIVEFRPEVHPDRRNFGWLILTDVAKGDPQLAKWLTRQLIAGLSYSHANFVNLRMMRTMPLDKCERIDPLIAASTISSALSGTARTNSYCYRIAK